MEHLRAVAETVGYFTRAEARRLGFDDNAIARMCRAGVWHRIRPGAYTFSDLWPDSAQSQQQLKGHVVVDRLAPNVALSHVNAALEHGLLVWDVDLSLTHVTRLDGTAGRRDAGVLHHEGFTVAEDLVSIGDRLVMNPVRAALETASTTSGEGGLVTLDSLLHQRRGTSETLEATFAAMEHWPDMRAVRLPMMLASEKPESVGESRSRWLFFTQNLPAPELQYPVHDDSGHLIGTTDFAWPDHRLLGEFDGKVKYGRLLRAGEKPEDAVFREKRREDRLCEQLGWRMVRLVWADLYHPAATAARVRRLMLSAA
jgi:hypothetical protein